VLHLLLQNDPGARGIPELAPVVSRHTAWTENRRFLLVPYHMIGARSMESAILGHYAAHVARLHPGAALPGIYKAESLFADAESLRVQIGDEAFFGRLNEGAVAASGWGTVAAGWEAASFEEARHAAPGQELRTRLVDLESGAEITASRIIATMGEKSSMAMRGMMRRMGASIGCTSLSTTSRAGWYGGTR